MRALSVALLTLASSIRGDALRVLSNRLAQEAQVIPKMARFNSTVWVSNAFILAQAQNACSQYVGMCQLVQWRKADAGSAGLIGAPEVRQTGEVNKRLQNLLRPVSAIGFNFSELI
jgi:hypothetical protein